MGRSPEAVEITVSFAGTLLHVARVSAGGSYRIGTARDVDLALDIAPLTSFPLVGATSNGFVVRCPVGVSAVMSTSERTITIAGGEIALQRGARIELGFGRVTISIRLVEGSVAPLARRPIERRPYVFAAGSLAAHLVVVIIAFTCARLDPIRTPVGVLTPERRPIKISRIEPPKPQPRPKAARQAAASQAAARQAEPAEPAAPPLAGAGAAAAQEQYAGGFGGLGAAFAALARPPDPTAFDGVGPVYDAEAANQSNFGGSGGRFDPSRDPAFASVKTGRYATVGTGRGAGTHYRLRGEVKRPEYIALTCDDNDCVVAGTMNRFQVRDVIESRYVDLLSCYTRHARSVPRVEMSLQFEIGADGKAGEVRAEGLEVVGDCVKRLVARAKFPASEQPTLVKRYTMAFWRSAPS